MDRLKIELPEAPDFSCELEVRIGEVNYGRHLGNDAVLALLHEARLRFLARHGFSELEAGGASLIMIEAAVSYLSQARHTDVLRIEVSRGECEKSRFELLYRMIRSGDQAEIARARTVLAFFDYQRGRAVRMPDLFRAALWPAVS